VSQEACLQDELVGGKPSLTLTLDLIKLNYILIYPICFAMESLVEAGRGRESIQLNFLILFLVLFC
jgi:hypothetical protein